jgi:outer membrane protein assembly factor BamB
MAFSRRFRRSVAFLAIAAAGAVVALEVSALARDDLTPANRPTATTAVSSSNPSAQASSVSLSIPAEPGEAVWFDTSGSVPIARRLRGAHISLPLGAVPLDTDHGRALIASADGATVSVLDLASGEAIAKWVAPFEVAHGQLRAERIYVDGVLEGKDAGVWTAALADDALAEFIAPPATTPEGVTGRGPLRASRSGMTVGSSLCGMTQCVLTQRRALNGQPETITDAGGLFDLTDSTSLLIAGQQLRAFTAGKMVWQLTTKGTFFGSYARSDGGSFVVSETTSRDAGALYAIELIDATSGASRILASWPDSEPQLRLIASLSSDHYALLLSAFTLEDAATDASAFVEVIDLERGSLLPGSAPLTTEANP